MLKQERNIVVQGSRERKTLLDVFWDDDYSAGPTILFCHGYKGYKDWGAWNQMGGYFAKQGFTFVKFNFSYNGGTTEDPIDFPDLDAFSQNNYSTEVNDIRAVIDQLPSIEAYAQTGSDSNSIFIIGHSRGGGIVSIAAAEDKRIKKVSTWAGVADLAMRFRDEEALAIWKKEGVIHVENSRTHQQMPHRYQFYEDYIANENRLNVLQRAGEITEPWLIVHAEDDATVPADQAIMLNAAQAASFVPFA